MTRLLLTTFALATAFTLAAVGSRSEPADAAHGFEHLVMDPTYICKSEPDGGTQPKPHGLLMVADRVPAPPCTQGG